MKQSIALSLVLALSVAIPAVSHAQSGGMKGMDMSKCKEMMQGMDMSECKDMMGKDKKGMEMKGMDMGKKPAAGAQTVHKATGVVKKLDSKAGTVTLAHEPVKSLNWPAMTMGFTVKDKALLDNLQPGKKVEIEFVQQAKDYVITSVK
jgi:Cu(I)/Ag(I) efflux system protein CusF